MRTRIFLSKLVNNREHITLLSVLLILSLTSANGAWAAVENPDGGLPHALSEVPGDGSAHSTLGEKSKAWLWPSGAPSFMMLSPDTAIIFDPYKLAIPHSLSHPAGPHLRQFDFLPIQISFTGSVDHHSILSWVLTSTVHASDSDQATDIRVYLPNGNDVWGEVSLNDLQRGLLFEQFLDDYVLKFNKLDPSIQAGVHVYLQDFFPGILKTREKIDSALVKLQDRAAAYAPAFPKSFQFNEKYLGAVGQLENVATIFAIYQELPDLKTSASRSARITDAILTRKMAAALNGMFTAISDLTISSSTDKLRYEKIELATLQSDLRKIAIANLQTNTPSQRQFIKDALQTASRIRYQARVAVQKDTDRLHTQSSLTTLAQKIFHRTAAEDATAHFRSIQLADAEAHFFSAEYFSGKSKIQPATSPADALCQNLFTSESVNQTPASHADPKDVLPPSVRWQHWP